MINELVKALRAVGSLGAVAPGAALHAFTGKTPDLAYQGMIRLFCLTRGVSNDIAHEVIRRVRGCRRLESPSGVLGRLDSRTLDGIGERLRRDGYYVFPERLSDETIGELLQLALASEGRYVEGTERAGEEEAARRTKSFDRRRPLGVRFEYLPATLVRAHAVQRLLADRSILAVAQRYLGCDPILDLVAMWWHTTASTQASAEAAQLFHFDMDRIKWLKFFFYLTDVDERSGPHVFVHGSHRRGGIPWRLLRKGYHRLTDQEVITHYGTDAVKRFTGPRGTIIAEDTRGLHKGAPVIEGDRLILQLEFVDSVFGAKWAGARIEKPCIDLVRAGRELPGSFRVYPPNSVGEPG